MKAELHAILIGLKLAWEKGYKRVIMESKSMTAVKKVIQPLQQKTPLSEIILPWKQFVCKIVHVYREANKCVDFLVLLTKQSS